MSEASKKCRRKRKLDMNWMKRHLIFINMVWASMLLLGSCTSESGTGTPDVNPVVPNKPTDKPDIATSQDEITFLVKGSWEDEADTRVTTIDTETDLQGYDIRVDAYYHGYSTAYLNNTRLRYSAPNWLFHNGTNWTQYYWPIDGSTTSGGSVTVDGLDFVGYLPYNLTNTYVTLGDYSFTNGPSFSCELPVSGSGPYTFDESNQSTLQEFLISYITDRKKNTPNESPMPSGVVPLAFIHPFSMVYFYLEEAPRGMKIESISLDNVYTQGTYVNASGWKEDELSKIATLSIAVNKTVPNELNYNGLIGGPYVVIPDVNLDVANTHTLSVSIEGEGSPRTTTITTPWEPRNKYNYKLNLGSDPDRILVNLEIEEWKTQSYKTPVEVN